MHTLQQLQNGAAVCQKSYKLVPMFQTGGSCVRAGGFTVAI